MPVIATPSMPTHELPHAAFTALATPSRGSRETSVWRVVLAANAPGVLHEVTREEVFVILYGAARVQLSGQESVAKTGDAIVVPPNTPFAISSAGNDPVEALCCLPVGGQARTLEGKVFTPPWAE
jgi:quercetin dioxygenase-like cupin family protein